MAKKILVVDDEHDTRGFAANFFRKRKFDVVTANDGQQALEMVRQENPDLILLDVLMPNMDGFQTLDKLKEDRLTKSIPVIMLTVKSQIDDVLRAIGSGAVDYIVKPFETAVLLEKISKALS